MALVEVKWDIWNFNVYVAVNLIIFTFINLKFRFEIRRINVTDWGDYEILLDARGVIAIL